MIPMKHFILAILILFGALNPSVYADCCAMEKKEESCCSLKNKKTHSEENKSEGCHSKSESNCHTNKITQIAGVQYVSCCVHQPEQFLNDFTPPVQERVQNPVQQKNIHTLDLLVILNRSAIFFSRKDPGSFGSFHAPPGWLSFRNIRC
jgi:hypothetical protein